VVYDYVAIIGEGLGLAARHFRRTAYGDRLLSLSGTSVPEIFIPELLRQIPHPELTIFGMGNEKGAGLFVARYLRGE
jgi:hypothetical protein